MKVITYNDPREYWQDISPYLKNEETKNNLLLGISYHLSNNSKECLYQSAIFEDNKIVGTNVCSRYRSN
ncbi:MAG: hypothetical protein KDD40_08790, partial [Bdellovibrionales bacterium]|nr:hypothetical protein [Bdellovibrionales bacterium]